jgi:hypothetical protein
MLEHLSTASQIFVPYLPGELEPLQGPGSKALSDFQSSTSPDKPLSIVVLPGENGAEVPIMSDLKRVMSTEKPLGWVKGRIRRGPNTSTFSLFEKYTPILTLTSSSMS